MINYDNTVEYQIIDVQADPDDDEANLIYIGSYNECEAYIEGLNLDQTRYIIDIA